MASGSFIQPYCSPLPTMQTPAFVIQDAWSSCKALRHTLEGAFSLVYQAGPFSSTHSPGFTSFVKATFFTSYKVLLVPTIPTAFTALITFIQFYLLNRPPAPGRQELCYMYLYIPQSIAVPEIR